MTTDDRARVIAKIQKLMALGDSDNEHEAALAAAQAAKLVTRYNVEQHELELSGKAAAEPIILHQVPWPVQTTSIVNRVRDGRKVKLTVIDVQDRWEKALAYNIAWGFYCQVFYNLKYVTFVGRQSDAVTAEYVWTHVREQLLRAVKPALREARRNPEVTNPKKYRRDWLLGAAAGVYQKLVDSRPKADPTTTMGDVQTGAQSDAQDVVSHESYSLMVVSRETEVKSYLQEKFPEMKSDAWRDIKLGAEAYWDGYEKGQEVEIHRAIETDADPHLTDSEPDLRRAELLKYTTSQLWDVVFAKLMRTGRPSDDATRLDVIEWIIEAEYYGLHIHPAATA